MLKNILKRLLSTVIVLIGVSIMAFALVRLGGGDPARLMLSETATEEEVEVQREKMGLDKPYVEQYITYMKGILQGDLGYSYNYKMPVSTLIMNRLPYTAKLAGCAMLLSILISIPLGVIAGVKKGTGVDIFATFWALLGQSLSPVWLGLLKTTLFGVTLRWLPTQGAEGIKTIIMPAICLAFQFSSLATRMTRSGMVDVLQEDYITATRARGVSKLEINTKYAFKNALLPVVTVVGSQVGSMLAGSMVIESLFGWPGLGQLTITAINARDFQLVQSSLLFSAFIFVLCNLIVDILYTFIDKRVKFS